MNSKRIADQLIARVGELPPMPAVAQKALTLLRDPDINMSNLASVLAMDEAMASLVLRWANSAYYGLKYPVSTVQQAVMYLGQKVLHSLILAASLASLLDRPASGYDLGRGDLWRHSLGIAAGARLVAASCVPQLAEEAYHAGLLADIGKLAFEILLRNVNTDSADWQGAPFSELEAAHFGIDHATLGAEMASRWHLPRPLIDAITYHHQPSIAKENTVLVDSVHIADAAIMTLGIGIGRDGLQYSLDPVACQRMKWNEEKLSEIVEKVLPFIEEADRFIRTRR